MREILFKAKTKKSGDWVSGYYVFASETLGKNNIHVMFDGYGLNMEVEIDPTTLCQYTGLTDQNGEKIFEGDIVTIENKPPFSDWVCKVVFKDCGFWLEGISRQTTVMLTDYRHVEMKVTGNIHEKED